MSIHMVSMFVCGLVPARLGKGVVGQGLPSDSVVPRGTNTILTCTFWPVASKTCKTCTSQGGRSGIQVFPGRNDHSFGSSTGEYDRARARAITAACASPPSAPPAPSYTTPAATCSRSLRTSGVTGAYWFRCASGGPLPEWTFKWFRSGPLQPLRGQARPRGL